jgi:hypothetical protein
MRRSSAASERLAALEIFLTDYSTPLMKQLESETELELFP